MTLSGKSTTTVLWLLILYLASAIAPLSISSTSAQDTEPRGEKANPDRLEHTARATDTPKVHWLWQAARSSGGTQSIATQQTVRITAKEYDELRTGKTRWSLRGAAESCRLTIRLDKTLIATVEPYQGPFQLELHEALLAKRSAPNSDSPRDRHTVSFEATATPGPSAFFCLLEVHREGIQPRTVLATTPGWQDQRTGEPLQSYGLVADEPWLSRRRQIGISTFDDYTQWKQALPATEQANGDQQAADSVDLTRDRYDLPEQFVLERLRTAQPDEDSWISMVFDPAGRLIVSKEQRGLLRFQFDATGQVADVRQIEDTLAECRGLAFCGNNLYINANNSKALFLLPYDVERQDFSGPPVRLRETPGGVGHGRNDLAVGPDGWLASIHGDSVDISRDAADRTSPLRKHRQGENSREGHLVRISPRGDQAEIVAAGLRNPYGVAFNQHGEAFTYDADAEFDMGSPWYRPTRIVHLTSGSDYGWRGVTGSWPPYYPDHPANAPPLLDIGKGSPTAVAFGTHSRFPLPYRESLFVLDWAYGRILAIHMEPQGASYVARAETFLKGRPLNVTDLTFGPDGYLYFITGGRKTQSALYRVKPRTTEGHRADTTALSSESQQMRERRRFAHRSRLLRRSLEALQEPGSAATVDHIWPLLDHEDPRIRYAARIGLEHQDVALWRARALAQPVRRDTLQALLVLARSPNDDYQRDAFERIRETDLDTLPESELDLALYILQLTLNDAIRSTTDVAEAEMLVEELRNNLSPLYPYDCVSVSSPPLNQRLSDLLAQCRDPKLVGKTLTLLTQESDQAKQLHYLFVLRNVSQGWNESRWRLYFYFLRDAERYLGGQGMPGFLAQIRKEARETADDDASLNDETLNSWLQVHDTERLKQLTADLASRKLIRQWRADDFTDLDQIDADQEGTISVNQGREIFHAALCSQCHRAGGEGRLLGPDLSQVARRFSRRDILLSILEPSRVVAENYRVTQLRTVDGRVLSGRVITGGDYRAPSLQIQTDPLKPDSVLDIPKDEIDEAQEQAQSWMPANLLDRFNKNEIASLLLFLENGGESAE